MTFALYGLFVLALWMVVGFAVSAIGFSTCCLGFVLFGTPYVGSVLLLPVLVTLRGLGPEFLGQFGSEYWAFEAATGPPAPPPPGASQATTGAAGSNTPGADPTGGAA